MYFKTSLDEFKGWCGAEITFERICDAGKFEEFEELMQERYGDEIPTEGEVNDFLRFEREYIYSYLGMEEE